MLVLKGCPRCHGDLLLTTYMDDRSTNCLQCGYSRQLPPPARKPEPLPVAFDDEPRRPGLRERAAMRRSARLAPATPRGASIP